MGGAQNRFSDVNLLLLVAAKKFAQSYALQASVHRCDICTDSDYYPDPDSLLVYQLFIDFS